MAYIDEQSKRIEDMYANLKKQKLGELANQNTQAVTDLRRQLSEQLPQYQTARAQADVGQVQDFNKLKEYMASNGAFNSGDNFSRASNILAQRTNKVNQINGNENAFTLGMNNKIADTNNQYNSNVNSVNSELDFQKLKAIEDLREKLRQEELQKQQIAEQRAYEAQQAEKAYQRQLSLAKRSGGGGSSSSKQPSVSQQNLDAQNRIKQISGNVMTYLDQWASGKASDQNGRATRSDMLDYLKSNAGILTQQGLDMDSMSNWVKNNYKWDKDEYGSWYKVE